MARDKITKRTVDSCLVQGRDYFVWDDGLRGFGLKVTKRLFENGSAMRLDDRGRL